VPLVAPLLQLLVTAASGGPAAWSETLLAGSLFGLTAGVLALAIGTTAWAVVLAVPTAFLLVRCDLPMRRTLGWLTTLPLAIPPYVAALAYAALLAPGGMLPTWLGQLAGVSAVSFPSLIYSAWGAGFVLGLTTYPYILLPLMGALERSSPTLDEVARSLGLGPRAVFWRVTLPLLRPALAAGALLVCMYALVDFGVVSVLRVRTFTTAVYTNLQAGLSLPAAARLSLLLVLAIWLILWFQRRALGAAGYSQVTSRARPAPPLALGRWRWLALGWCAAILALALLVPLLVLGLQLARFSSGAALAAFAWQQLPFLVNTLVVAFGGATSCLVLALLVAWAGPRLPLGRLAAGALQAGYAVPGTVLGLALVGLYLTWLRPAYGTPLGLALAYVVLFGAHAYQATRAALLQISPSMEEAARGLGRTPLRALVAVVLPLAGPGILGGWLLVLVLALRELSATIVLRPPGYDTLAVRVWVHVMDVGPDPRGAAVSLVLVGVVTSCWLLAAVLRPRALRPAN
jgi:iron(III) transport system permease protein